MLIFLKLLEVDYGRFFLAAKKMRQLMMPILRRLEFSNDENWLNEMFGNMVTDELRGLSPTREISITNRRQHAPYFAISKNPAWLFNLGSSITNMTLSNIYETDQTFQKLQTMVKMVSKTLITLQCPVSVLQKTDISEHLSLPRLQSLKCQGRFRNFYKTDRSDGLICYADLPKLTSINCLDMCQETHRIVTLFTTLREIHDFDPICLGSMDEVNHFTTSLKQLTSLSYSYSSVSSHYLDKLFEGSTQCPFNGLGYIFTNTTTSLTKLRIRHLPFVPEISKLLTFLIPINNLKKVELEFLRTSSYNHNDEDILAQGSEIDQILFQLKTRSIELSVLVYPEYENLNTISLNRNIDRLSISNHTIKSGMKLLGADDLAGLGNVIITKNSSLAKSVYASARPLTNLTTLSLAQCQLENFPPIHFDTRIENDSNVKLFVEEPFAPLFPLLHTFRVYNTYTTRTFLGYSPNYATLKGFIKHIIFAPLKILEINDDHFLMAICELAGDSLQIISRQSKKYRLVASVPLVNRNYGSATQAAIFYSWNRLEQFECITKKLAANDELYSQAFLFTKRLAERAPFLNNAKFGTKSGLYNEELVDVVVDVTKAWMEMDIMSRNFVT